ncbi:MAG TPA: FAD-binding oxidoreductase [Terriglobales bacterium]|jgi:glycine/D-amino acid oxidase-like deaminating enzyme|nr:FAD-binding oxidoreductase [Terriglobales bacterium]
MQLNDSNYWLTTAAMPSGTAGEVPARTDVAIIGAGFTGLSAARTLAKRGVNVVILEANSIGWGASSRNGGMVLTGLKLSPETLSNRYGMELTRKMYAASLASIDLVGQIVREDNITCDFSRCGHLEVACKPSHFDSYARSVETIAREFNHQLRVIPRVELADEIGSSIYHGGIVDDSSAGVNPARYVSGLAAAALTAGARIFHNATVQQIAPASNNGSRSLTLQTTRGNVKADNVLIATSGYTSSATPALRKKIIPIGSFIITTEPLSDSLARELSPRNRMIYDSKHYLYYYRLTPDNRMLFGGRAAFFPETKNTIRRSAEILRRGMIDVFPQLRDTKLAHAWGGTLDFCFDTMPHSGQMDGIYYALGYAGHGVAMATYLGAKIAEHICGDETDIPFSAIPFPGAPLGLYNGRPWFLPFAGAYYKVLDWIS